MSPDEFWNGDVELVKAYRRAYEYTQQQWNVQAYLNGFYTYQAILRASPVLHAFAKRGTKPMPYLDKPVEMATREQQKEKEQNKGKELQDKISNAFEAFNRRFREKHKK